ncbi:MAG TPA: hypothetical protein VN783_17180 [Thermoanaerobaculia bacterium]|nr:hypothetical protein [Thermoanaerobaculia bacterium]
MDRPVNLEESLELCLRQEIRDTQKSESDILKWKFLAVAGVGSVALGGLRELVSFVAPKSVPGPAPPTAPAEIAYGLLCLVPLICLYTDLICLHYTLRIITIGAFIKRSYEAYRARQAPGIPLDYESFVFETRANRWNPFNLEIFAIIASSAFLSATLLVLAKPWTLPGRALMSPRGLLAASSLAGLIGTGCLQRSYLARIQAILDKKVEKAGGRAAKKVDS